MFVASLQNNSAALFSILPQLHKGLFLPCSYSRIPRPQPARSCRGLSCVLSKKVRGFYSWVKAVSEHVLQRDQYRSDMDTTGKQIYTFYQWSAFESHLIQIVGNTLKLFTRHFSRGDLRKWLQQCNFGNDAQIYL